MSKYNIQNTTREEKMKGLADAEAIMLLGGQKLAEEDEAMIQEYIDGKMEINDVLQKIIHKYKEN